MTYTYNDLLSLDQTEIIGKILNITAPNKTIYFAFVPDEKLGGLQEHKTLIDDFNDTKYLEYFVNLLLENPDNAYTKYFITRDLL